MTQNGQRESKRVKESQRESKKVNKLKESHELLRSPCIPSLKYSLCSVQVHHKELEGLLLIGRHVTGKGGEGRGTEEPGRRRGRGRGRRRGRGRGRDGERERMGGILM